MVSPGVRANGLWPQTTIATAAVQNLLGGAEAPRRPAHRRSWATRGRRAAHDAQRPSGRVFGDVEALARGGVTDLSQYGGTDDLELDFCVDSLRHRHRAHRPPFAVSGPAIGRPPTGG